MIQNQPQERTVLVVDDQPSDRELVGAILAAEESLRIEVAGDGVQALEYISASPPDLVVTDLNMPQMDGVELIENLRSTHPSMPIVVTTSYDVELADVTEHGASQLIAKEKCREDLLPAVSSLLSHVDEIGSDRDRNVPTEVRCCISNDPHLIPPTIDRLVRPLFDMPSCKELDLRRIEMAIEEVLFHALYYGNLEMPRSLADENGTRGVARDQESFAERCKQAPYRDRTIVVAASVTPDMAKFTIRHDGIGFHTRATHGAPCIPESALRLARTYMTTVKLNEDGTQVTMRKRLDERSVEVDAASGRQTSLRADQGPSPSLPTSE